MSDNTQTQGDDHEMKSSEAFDKAVADLAQIANKDANGGNAADAQRVPSEINLVTVNMVWSSLPSKEREASSLGEMVVALRDRYSVETVSDDVDVEQSDIDGALAETGITPFDTSAIRIESDRLSVYSLVSRLKDDAIDLDTDFQRKAGLWSDTKKSQLIESLLLNIPLPAFYFDASDSDNWLVIDGLQRLSAINDFMVKKTLKLTNMEYLHDMNGLSIDELPSQFRRRIEEANVTVYKLKAGTPENVKYNIFKRLNTGGLELTAQEIRHALYRKASGLLDELAKSDEFLTATGGSIATDRMLDREFVLRYIAVCYYGIDKMQSNSDDYLNGAMQFIENAQTHDPDVISEIRTALPIDMQCAYDIFGRNCFRKIGFNGWRRPINKAVFEVWSAALSPLTPEEQHTLVERRDEVVRRFTMLCDAFNAKSPTADERIRSNGFVGVLRSGDPSVFSKRFTYVSDIVREVLNAD